MLTNHVCGISYNTSFAHTLGHTERSYTVSDCQCTLYTVHCITTVLLNHTISGKIGMDIVNMDYHHTWCGLCSCLGLFSIYRNMQKLMVEFISKFHCCGIKLNRVYSIRMTKSSNLLYFFMCRSSRWRHQEDSFSNDVLLFHHGAYCEEWRNFMYLVQEPLFFWQISRELIPCYNCINFFFNFAGKIFYFTTYSCLYSKLVNIYWWIYYWKKKEKKNII